MVVVLKAKDIVEENQTNFWRYLKTCTLPDSCFFLFRMMRMKSKIKSTNISVDISVY